MESCEKMVKRQIIFIGLGLYDYHDVSLKGLQELKNADQVFAEFYTAKLGSFHQSSFEKMIGKKIQILSREETEKGDVVLDDALEKTVVFLTCGDPMIATTHIDLRLRAIKKGISTKIIHNSSIVTAAPGLLGLQNYKFGRTTTLPFPERNFFPTSPYDVIEENQRIGLHSLVLLDIQAEKNRYMTANEGLEVLLKMEEKRNNHLFSPKSVACVVARAGAEDSIVAADEISALQKRQFGPPLHTIVIPGNLHFMEVEALELLAGLPPELGRKIQKL